MAAGKMKAEKIKKQGIHLFIPSTMSHIQGSELKLHGNPSALKPQHVRHRM